MDRVRDHVSHQYSNQLHSVFAREKATANPPCSSVSGLKDELKLSLPRRSKAEPASSDILQPPQTNPASYKSRNNGRSVGQAMSVSDPFEIGRAHV